MPNHLLELQSMKLMGKADIAKHLTNLSRDFIYSWHHDKLFDDNASVEKSLFTFIQANSTYGILSHRWLPEGELTFQDMQTSFQALHGLQTSLNLRTTHSTKATLEPHWNWKSNPGFYKVIKFCEVASKYGCKFVWFDTGCINKTSSAELEESIRSMFNWYCNSSVCIVHLAQTTNGANIYKDPWFTRGWTLQELLAPPTIKFYDKFWRPLTPANNDKIPDVELGSPLWEIIQEITSIPQEDLLSFKPGVQNVRQRMAWASKRMTTRVEDMAYCLIGIFNVSLSVAYGEGDVAFYRLQTEIMQRSNDKALFAWNGLSSVHNSMFAAAPICFAAPLNLQAMQSNTEYTLTNRGLRISLLSFRVLVKPGTGANKYVLESPECGIIGTVTFTPQPKFTHLRVALLGDTQSTITPLAILLDFDESTRCHKRVGSALNIKCSKNLSLEQMFII